MSISQNFPNTRPSLNLNFARSKTLDPRITFTRSQTGNGVTYVGEDGLIKYASADEPRFDHDPETGECLGLLIEEQRSNLVTYSEEFDSANWTQVFLDEQITANEAVAPNGLTVADKVSSDSGVTAEFGVGQAISVTANTPHTISIFAKAADSNFLYLRSYGGTSNVFYTIIVDLSSGTVTKTATGSSTTNVSNAVTAYPNGWYRISITATHNHTYYYLIAGPAPSSTATIGGSFGQVSYLGAANQSIYLWGAQLEAGAFPTSYIPTSGSTETRSPDNVSMTGDNFLDWYNPSEGSIFASYSIIGSNSDNTVVAINNTTQNEQIDSRWFVSGTGYRVRVVGVNQASYALGDSPPLSNKNYKTSFGYKQNDFMMTIGGIQGTLDDSGNLPTLAQDLAQMELGKRANAGRGNIRLSQLTYYPVRLPNSTLQTLTK